MSRITAVILALVLASTQPALAQSVISGHSAEPAGLTVNGEGASGHAPDQATLSLDLVTNDAVAATASAQNNRIYAALRTRLAAVGVPESALRTTGFNLAFVPKPLEAAQYRPPRIGYVVTRSIAVTLADLAGIGRAIDAAVSAGATEIGGVAYGLRDPRAAYREALAAAMRDADAQARAVATAAGVGLDGIRSINTGAAFTPFPRPQPMARMASAVAAPTELPPPSSIEVRATVTVVYALRRP